MRIISGLKKSREIKFVKSSTTRPTMDKIREAVFNTLGDVTNLTTLDIFAGSGGYSLEALSRMAKLSYINDKDIKCYKIIKENLDNLEFKNFKLFKQDYKDLLESLKLEGIKFDIVFIDPPYHDNLYSDVLLKLDGIVKNSSIIVIETLKKIEFEIPLIYDIIKEKEYSENKIIYLKRR